MTLRINEAYLARDVHAVLAKIAQGDEVIVERDDHRPVALIKQAVGVGRDINECITIAMANEDALGYAPVPDCDFQADVNAWVESNRYPIRNVWDE